MATSQPSNALIEGAELGSEHVVLILVGLVASGKVRNKFQPFKIPK